MKPEEQVVSLALAKRLREAGWVQEGATFYWLNTSGPRNEVGNWRLRWEQNEYQNDISRWLAQENKMFAAPTLSELADAIPIERRSEIAEGIVWEEKK